MSSPAEIAIRLQEIRNSLGLSQRQMALKINVSHRTWQNLEAAGSYPGGQTLLGLATQGFDPTWILTGIGSMKIGQRDTGAGEIPADPELLANIIAVIIASNPDMTPAEAGMLAAAPYDDIRAATGNEEERKAMVKLFAVQLRRTGVL